MHVEGGLWPLLFLLSVHGLDVGLHLEGFLREVVDLLILSLILGVRILRLTQRGLFNIPEHLLLLGRLEASKLCGLLLHTVLSRRRQSSASR